MRFCFNPYRGPVAAVSGGGEAALAFHRALAGYAPTPLHACPALAARLGLGAVYVKDESARFGLQSFKALGASWAMHRFVERHGLPSVFATATDGNHGRAVAWAARRMGRPARVFVPRNTVAARIAAIRAEGAEVEIVDGTYDDAVRRCAALAAARRWQVISDTGYPGYLEIPDWVMEGYRTLFRETGDQLAAAGLRAPDVVVVQAGVGGLCGAAVAHYRPAGDGPFLIAVEPDDADCLLESILSPGGAPQPSRGSQNSIMSGLNCGEASLCAWPLNRAGVDLFLSIEDRYAEDAMRLLHRPAAPDPAITAGESGAAGLAGLLALCTDARLTGVRRRTPLSASAAVLLLNTEGGTDPTAYSRIVNSEP